MNQHGERLERSRRIEEDLRQRLQARLRSVEAGDAQGAPGKDPVAVRLAFLLAKTRRRREALEEQLAQTPAIRSC